jgi:hypothetical protein
MQRDANRLTMVQMVVCSDIGWRTRWNDEEKVTFGIELEHKPLLAPGVPQPRIEHPGGAHSTGSYDGYSDIWQRPMSDSDCGVLINDAECFYCNKLY